MKKIFILITTLTVLFSKAQTVIVNYTERRIINKERLDEMPEFMKKEATQEHNYILNYNDGISMYKNSSENKNFESETKKTTENKEITYKITNKSITKYYYKNISKDKILFNFTSGSNNFYGNDNFLKWEWQFTEETKKINGFICKKATSTAYGYNFTAWYTEDVAINAGPEKFDGLPGLIIYLGTPYFEWIATSVKIEKTPIEIEEPKIVAKTYTMLEINKINKDAMSKLRNSSTNETSGNTTTKNETFILKN